MMKLRDIRVKVLEAADWATLETDLQAWMSAAGEKELVAMVFSEEAAARVVITYTE